jgi:hypothetical protein
MLLVFVAILDNGIEDVKVVLIKHNPRPFQVTRRGISWTSFFYLRSATNTNHRKAVNPEFNVRSITATPNTEKPLGALLLKMLCIERFAVSA